MKAAIFDVDGVLTDGRLFIGEHGELFKGFCTLDGHGLKLLAQGGIVPIVITGRDSPAVRRRVATSAGPCGLRCGRQAGRRRAGAGRAGRRLARACRDGRRQARPALLTRAGGLRPPTRMPRRRPWPTTSPRRPAAMAPRASSVTCC
jgi:hypothetical protein